MDPLLIMILMMILTLMSVLREVMVFTHECENKKGHFMELKQVGNLLFFIVQLLSVHSHRLDPIPPGIYI